MDEQHGDLFENVDQMSDRMCIDTSWSIKTDLFTSVKKRNRCVTALTNCMMAYRSPSARSVFSKGFDLTRPRSAANTRHQLRHDCYAHLDLNIYAGNDRLGCRRKTLIVS